MSGCAVQGLDLFLAGDDVPTKKPDPAIYHIAAERLQVDPARSLVIEDSMVGLQVRCAWHTAVTSVTSSPTALHPDLHEYPYKQLGSKMGVVLQSK